MKRTWIVAVLVCAGCGKREAKELPKVSLSVCDALAISADVARALRDQVGQQLASADHAMTRAEEWDQKIVPPEKDGSGLYSGAGQRAFAYERTASGVCHSAWLVDRGLLELARSSALEPEIATVDDGMKHMDCRLGVRATANPVGRRASAAEWSAMARDARELEDRLVQVCYERAGGTRRESHLPAMLMLTE